MKSAHQSLKKMAIMPYQKKKKNVMFTKKKNCYFK